MVANILVPRFEYKNSNGFEYPKYFEYWEKALSSVWNYKVGMTEDILNWESASEYDRKIIGGILRAFTQTECVVGDVWIDYCKKFRKPEILMMAIMFAMYEGLHQAAYNHLSSSLGIDEYKAYMSDKTAQDKINYLLNDIDSLKVRLAVFSGAVEGVALFSAFSILLSYCKQGTFKGLSQIISWSINDETCLHGDTQILTTKGWKHIKDYVSGEKIAQFNPHSKEITFVEPLKFIKTKSDKFYKVFKKRRYSQILTPGHTVVDYHESTKEVRETPIEKWSKRQSYLPVSGYLSTRKINALDKFLIALQADGCIRGGASLREVRFGLKRVRKIERFRELAKELRNTYGFKIKEYEDKRREGFVNFSVLIPDEYLPLRTKFFDEYYTYDNIPDGFVDEIQYWDGSSQEGIDTIYYSTKEHRNILFVQSAGSLNGFYGHIFTQEDLRHSKPCLIYRIQLKKVTSVPARCGIKEEVFLENEIESYCFKVPTQAFLIRHNGLISITGNCHSDAGGDLFKDLVKEDDITDGEIELIIEGFDNVLKNELVFLDNIIKDGDSINGIRKECFINFLYSRYNNRLANLNIDHSIDYDKDLSYEVSSWFNLLASGQTNQDFFAYMKDGSQYVAKPTFDKAKVDWSSLANRYLK